MLWSFQISSTRFSESLLTRNIIFSSLIINLTNNGCFSTSVGSYENSYGRYVVLIRELEQISQI